MFDAVAYMIAQELFLNSRERSANRADLCDDVDTVAVLFHHSGQPTDLALDTIEAFLA